MGRELANTNLFRGQLYSLQSRRRLASMELAYKLTSITLVPLGSRELLTIIVQITIINGVTGIISTTIALAQMAGYLEEIIFNFEFM
jgi:hypothetical protein